MTGDQLRAARLTLGFREGLGRSITQKELCRRLRMGSHAWQTMSRWENGKAEIPGPVSVAVEGLLRTPR